METPTVGGHADASSSDRPALDAIVHRLACPHCRATPLRRDHRSIRCRAGHSFDIARQGYVSLLSGRHRHRGDTAAMVAARETFLSSDHFRPLRSTITALAAEHAPRLPELVVDLAGGIGHYLSSVLDALPGSWGLAVDLSPAALRRASRAHPRAAAIAADVWEPLPLAPRTTGVVLSVFGPRTVAEIDRILTDEGVAIVATAGPEHLRELRDRVGTIGVDPRKPDRLRRAFTGFVQVAQHAVRWRLALRHDEVGALAAMGPSAHHSDPEQRQRAIEQLPDLVGVTAAMDVTVLRRQR
ncbi:putative RNA methyltransferase [Pseudonocardia nantongensis]|uniref:putative RNA methyltransferase n=1 Tax=Pseudonocardia nantongensis TaxID=1181885 RepID=UPI00397A00FF